MVQLLGILIHLLYCCRYGPVLESVITITEELAYEQARRADQLLAEGNYLGNNFSSIVFSVKYIPQKVVEDFCYIVII